MAIRRPLAVAAAAALLFLLEAWWVMDGQAVSFDESVRDGIHAWASPIATHVLSAITMLGSQAVMLPILATLVLRLALLHRRRQAVLLAAGELSAELASHLLKLAFHRARPLVFFGLTPSENASFPSGHAFIGSTLYGLIACLLASAYPQRRGLIVAGTCMLAFIIGFTRVYLGYHYPSDVLGGWACAAVWLSLYGPPIYASGKREEQNRQQNL